MNSDLTKIAEQFRSALMNTHSHDWTMEEISEAAHVCAAALSSSAKGAEPWPPASADDLKSGWSWDVKWMKSLRQRMKKSGEDYVPGLEEIDGLLTVLRWTNAAPVPKAAPCPHCDGSGWYENGPKENSDGSLVSDMKRCECNPPKAAPAVMGEHVKQTLKAALNAAITMCDRGPQPKKLYPALRWIENDELARKMVADGIALLDSLAPDGVEGKS